MGRSRSRSHSRSRRQHRNQHQQRHTRSRDRTDNRSRRDHRDSTRDARHSTTSRSRRDDRSRSNDDNRSKPKSSTASRSTASTTKATTAVTALTKSDSSQAQTITRPPRKSRWGQEPSVKVPELNAEQQAIQAKLAQEEQSRIAEQTAEAHLLASAAAHTSSIQPQVSTAPKPKPTSKITTGSNNTKINYQKQQNGHQPKYGDSHAQMKDQDAHADQKDDADEDDEDKEDAEHADFGLSGALQEDTETGNLKNGVVLKFAEPEDAAQPDQRWRLYVFKNKKMINTLFLHRSSAYLVGRDPRVADILTEHSSISKQHAVIQFRFKRKPAPPGSVDAPPPVVRPYILDLESTNGVWLNGTAVDHSRYVELLDKDVIKFGESTREYVIMSPEVVKE